MYVETMHKRTHFIYILSMDGISGKFFRSVNLLLHGMMCVPADKHHPDVHGARCEDEMEKAVPIWYVVF